MGNADTLRRIADKTLESVGPKQSDHDPQSETESTRRRSPTRIDAVMQGVNADIANATADVGPATEADLRSNAIEQITGNRSLAIEIIAQGTSEGFDLLQTPDKAPASVPNFLIDAAAAMLISGSASGIAARMATVVVDKIAKKAVEYALKEGLKTVGKAALTPTHGVNGTTARTKLVKVFKNSVGQQLLEARNTLVHRPITAALTHLPLADLVQLAQHLQDARTSHLRALTEDVKTSTVVAWTNFLARANYGAMGSWNIWAEHGGDGAVQLDGAAASPIGPEATHEVTAGNVAPRAMDAIADASGATGILEIAMTSGGALFERGPGHGMRLANVGPSVREHLRGIATVRAAPINKLIRLYDVTHAGSTEVVKEIGSILITADGYVRRYDLGPETRIVPDPRPITFREVIGVDHRQFRLHRQASEALVRDIAERAQDLPMSMVED